MFIKKQKRKHRSSGLFNVNVTFCHSFRNGDYLMKSLSQNYFIFFALMKEEIILFKCFCAFLFFYGNLGFSKRNIQQQREDARQRTFPRISKSREAEIRKILRANLQNTRQRVRKSGGRDDEDDDGGVSRPNPSLLFLFPPPSLSAALLQQTRPLHGPV